MIENTSGLRVGLSGEFSVEVTEETTADYYGNEGVRVLATPHLVWMVERAGNVAVDPILPSGMASVGTRIDLRHLAPTPLGLRATARVLLVDIRGERLIFDVEAWDEMGKIARGSHERHILELEPFLQRAGRKKPGRERPDHD